jgi:hypothetical protein
MVVEIPTSDSLRRVFEGVLHCALTRGRMMSEVPGLGPGTVAAIAAVASEHPDADAALITAAYDVFDREHRGMPGLEIGCEAPDPSAGASLSQPPAPGVRIGGKAESPLT